MTVRQRGILRSLAAAVLWWAFVLPAWAEVVRIEITRREPFAEGREFGSVGAYEKIVGRIYYAVRPDDPRNAVITDIQRAPKTAEGRVEFWSDFFLLKPVDSRRGNGKILYDVNNRGNKLALGTFNGARGNNPTTAADAGNGFLMRLGYSVLWSGWNAEVAPGNDRMTMSVPIATDNGKPIIGRMHVEICRDERVDCQPLYWSPWGSSLTYSPLSLDTTKAELSVRPRRDEPATVISPDRWAFGRLEDGKFVPDSGWIWLKDGIQPGQLYDLVYEVRDPKVLGLGLAGVRDCVSFFRYATHDSQQNANPLAGAIRHAYIFGISQSGRFVRHFIYEGFNEDEQGRIVFDGGIAHAPGAGRLTSNQRFGVLTFCAAHHEHLLTPSEAFPFATVPQEDHVTGEKGDLLARARRSGTVPKLFVVQSSSEYWTRAASLKHTDVEGQHDLEVDPSVRIYLVAGSQHLGGGPTDRGICRNMCNPLDDRGPVLRALLVALDRWVSTGEEPPSSRYPKIADGTLVDLAKFREQFPKIPGVVLPTSYYMPYRLDFGPRYAKEGIADIIPPHTGRKYRTLIPAVDADGNELAGIRLPEVAVPVATYTGWNLRAPEFGAAEMLAPYHGSYLPFAISAAERQQNNDPRPAVRERYPTRADYLAKIAEAIRRLRAERLLLEEDAAVIEKRAAERRLWDD